MVYTLYGWWASSATFRVRIVLAHKKIPYKSQIVDLKSKQHLSENWVSMNPMKQIPLLKTEKGCLTQSMSIIQYLEDTHPIPSMIPSDLYLKSKMNEICQIVNSGIQPLQGMSNLEKIKTLGGDQKSHAAQVISIGFQAIEKILKQTAGNFCIKNQLTFADALLVPQMYRANIFNVNMTPFPTITQVLQNLNKVPAVKEADIYNQPDSPKLD